MRRNWLTISFPDWLTINWREEDAHNEDFLLVVFVRLDTKCFNPPQADHDLYSTKVRDCNVAIQVKLLQLPAKKTDAFAGYFFSRYYATCQLVFSVLEVEMPALVEILHFFFMFLFYCEALMLEIESFNLLCLAAGNLFKAVNHALQWQRH